MRIITLPNQVWTVFMKELFYNINATQSVLKRGKAGVMHGSWRTIQEQFIMSCPYQSGRNLWL